MDRKEQQNMRHIEPEDKLGVLIDQAPVGITATDSGVVIYCNRAAAAMYGYASPEDLVGRDVSELIHHDDLPGLKELSIRIWKGIPMESPLYFRAVRPDGSIATIEGYGFRFRFKDKDCILSFHSDITGRRNVEEELRTTNSILSTLVQAIPDIVYYKDASGKNLEVNRAYEELTGLKRNELIGRTDREILPGALADQCMRSDNAAIEHGGPLKLEESFRSEEGDELYFETIKAPVFNDEGTLTGLVGVSRDISSRKRSEKELIANQARLQTVVSAAKDGVIMIDGKGQVSLWNKAAERMFGYPAHEAIGKDLHHLIAPERYLESYKNGFQRFQSTGTGTAIGMTIELSALRNTGEEFPIELSLSPVLIGDAWHAVGTVRDITERKQAEQTIRESEARYRFLTENMGDMAFVVDLDFNTTYVSPAVERLLGFTQEERMRQNPKDQITPESFDEAVRTLAYELEHDGQEGVDPDRSVMLELAYYHKDGTIKHLETNFRGIRNEKGKPVALYGISRDITGRKRAEEERIAMERRVQQAQKLESLGVMAGGIAHDFNNLLAVILGNLDMAQMNLGADSPAMENIIESEKAARRAANLTRQILAYSGKERFRLEPVNISAMLRGMDDLIAASVAHTASVRKDLAEDLPFIQGDQAQIQQVIMNITINASEALGEKPGSIAISTGIMDCDEAFLNRSRIQKKPSPGRFVYLKVEDTGSGMDKATLARVFDPFYTTRFLGRGLGLPAVLGIVGGHHGAIMMDSTPGIGTTVLLLFPEIGGEPAGKITGPARSIPRGEQSCEKGTIMVVDDDDMVRNTCSALLRHLGYSTVSAGGGREAIRMLTELRDTICCVILDLTMPDLDGAATSVELKRIEPGVRIILSSGYSRQEATRFFPEGDLAGYIQKPYQISTLKVMLEQVLKG